MLMLILGCAEESLVLTALSPALDPLAAEALTNPESRLQWELHTRVNGNGAARLFDDGVIFADSRHYGETIFPVVDANVGVRVMAQDHGVRTLLWLDRENLADVVAETTWVNAAGQPVEGNSAGIRIPSGSEVEWTKNGAQVSINAHLITTEIRISPALIDQYWAEQPESQNTRDHEALAFATLPIQGKTTVFDDDGRRLLTLGGSDGTGVAMVSQLETDRVRGTLILLDAGNDLLVRGWVSPKRLGSVPSFEFGTGWGCGCCGFGGWGTALRTPVWLERGTVLYDQPGGEIVGLTFVSVQLERLITRSETEGEWDQILAPTPFGTGALWARHAEYFPDDGNLEDEAKLLAEANEIEVREADLGAWVPE